MGGTTSRVLQVLELLESSGIRTLRDLAEHLDVDERTIRRYIDHLRDLDIPVESVRGRYGGYRLAAGYRMPPLMLSADEALAVVLGLLHAQTAAGLAHRELQTAMSKVRRALPRTTAQKLETLLRTAAFTETAATDMPDAAILLTVADAVAAHRVLSIRYASPRQSMSREVHPLDLVNHSGRWYLLAHDTTADAERTFRIDRICTARLLPERFQPAEPGAPADGAVTRLVESFARADYTWHVILRVQADESHIRTRLPASVAMIEPIPNSAPEQPWHRVEIHAESLDWIPDVIVALRCPVLIDAPDNLRTLLAAIAARLSTAASS